MVWKKLSSSRGLAGRDSVLVAKTGDLSLGAAVFDLLGRPERVVLFWDTDTERLGIKAAKDGEAGSVKVAQATSATSSRRVGAKFAFEQVGVKPARGVYTPKPDGELFCIGPLVRADTPPVSVVRDLVRAAGR